MYTLVKKLRRVRLRSCEVRELLEELVRDVLLLLRGDHDRFVGADPTVDLGNLEVPRHVDALAVLGPFDQPLVDVLRVSEKPMIDGRNHRVEPLEHFRCGFTGAVEVRFVGAEARHAVDHGSTCSIGDRKMSHVKDRDSP